MRLPKFLSQMFLRSPHFAQMDLGILKVAFMIAALDGKVTEEEYAAFDEIAKKCKGYTPENAESVLRQSMRSAGYLLLLGQRVDDEAFVKAFIDEAIEALPGTFATYDPEVVKCAFDLWLGIANSDNEYSPRERLCLEALKKLVADIRKCVENALTNTIPSPTF